MHQGIPVATVARTLLDLATVLNPQQLARAVNETEVQRLLSPLSLNALLERYPGAAEYRPSGHCWVKPSP